MGVRVRVRFLSEKLQTFDQADKYFSGDGMFDSRTKPFFISLPLRRNLDPKRFAEQIKMCYIEDYTRLLEVGWNEAA
jgi:hypothetical protein